MKAAVNDRYGPPDVVRIAEVAKPTPGHDELLVKVHATTVNRTAGDFTRDTRTYDVVLDAVGKSSFLRCRRLLKPGGSYLSSDAGPLWRNFLLAPVTPLFGRRKTLFRPPRHDRETVRYLQGLLESGQFRPLVDRRHPPEQIVEAYRYVETGQKVGSGVITVAPAGS